MATDSDVVTQLFSVDAWQAKLVKTSTGQLSECWQNVCLILTHHPAWMGVVGFDEFATRAVKRRLTPTQAAAGDWGTEDTYLLGLWLAQNINYPVKSLATLDQGMLAAANANKFNPVLEWFATLAWDHTDRLDFWMHECLGVKPGAYASLVGRYSLMNVVARVIEPGCIMRSVPILEGAQNKGKSTALRILAEPWFGDSHLDLSNKDAYEVIQGKMIYEIGEMHAFSKAEASKVKQFVSSRKDRWVPKYVRHPLEVQRSVCFFGSINPDGAGYLRDWTGNTRFWPVLCMEDGPIDLDKVGEWRDQLFAEALFRYKAGERRYPSDEEEALHFEPEQAARLTEHPWLEPIANWLNSIEAFEAREKGELTASRVLTQGVPLEKGKQTQQTLADVGRVMRLLGYERVRSTDDGRPWFYRLPAARLKKEGDAP